MPPTPAEALNTSLSRNLSGRGDPVTDPVTDKCLDRCINRAARKQMPPDQHRRLLSLLCLMQLSIQWWLAKRADDLKQVPLAVAREHLKAEHEAFARESELLDAQRKQIDSEKQMLARAKSFLDRERQALAAEKRKLFVERQHLEAEKKMVRARHEALVQASVPILEQEERMTIIPQETGSLGGKPQHSNSEQKTLTTPTSRKRTLSNANLDEDFSLPPERQSPRHRIETQVTQPTPAPASGPTRVTVSPLEAGIRTTIAVLNLHIHAIPNPLQKLDINVSPAIMAAVIDGLFRVQDQSKLESWRSFERAGNPGQWYCWFGLINHGDRHTSVADGKCVCKHVRTPGLLRNHYPRCILVRRNGGTGLCSFVWRELLEQEERERTSGVEAMNEA